MKKIFGILAIMISSVAIFAQCNFDTTSAVRKSFGIDGAIFSENSTNTFELGTDNEICFLIKPVKHWKLYRFGNPAMSITTHIDRIAISSVTGANQDVQVNTSHIWNLNRLYSDSLYNLSLVYHNVSNTTYTDSIDINYNGHVNDAFYGAGGNTSSYVHYNQTQAGSEYADVERFIRIVYTIDSNTTGIKINSITDNPSENSIQFSSSNLTLNYNSKNNTNKPLYIYNTSGQLISTQNVNLNSGDNKIELPLNLTPGMYIVKFNDLSKKIATF